MIGLGSNRLSVCRRGGMSVTQAGRGGMEWLAGGRVPDWITPYSAQATAALKAQFPTQWPTIRDYGFAHPEYIAAINFAAPQDPEIMYSLIAELGKDRWLIGNGTDSYVETNYKPNNNTKVHCVYKLQSGGTKIAYGVSDESPSASQAWGMLKIYDNPNRYGFGYVNGTTIDSSVGSSMNTKYDLVQDKNELYINGTKIMTMPASTWQARKSLWLYARNGGTAFYSNDMKTIFEIWDNGTMVRKYIPCKHDGVKGCLEILSATMAEIHGTFQISETPAP